MAVEAVMVIVIGLIFSAYAYSQYATNYKLIKEEVLRGDLVKLRDNIILGAFSSRSDYSGLDETVAKDMDYFPPGLVGGYGPGGSSIAITVDPVMPTVFDIELNDIDDNEGFRLCVAYAGNAHNEWQGVAINGGSHVANRDLDTLRGDCDGATSLSFRAG